MTIQRILCLSLSLSGTMACYNLAQAQSYRVTLSNLTTGQPFSPYVFATHDASENVWQPGDFASPGIRQIAEEGNNSPLVADLSTQLGSSVGALYTGSGLLSPGAVTSFLLETDAAHPLLSTAWMLGVTNDGFSGVNALNLSAITGTVSFDLVAYDAGTEVNNESRLYVPALGGILNDPEHAVISLHPGILGIGDIGIEHAFTNPVARLTIVAVPEPGTGAIAMVSLVGITLLSLRRRRYAH